MTGLLIEPFRIKNHKWVKKKKEQKNENTRSQQPLGTTFQSSPQANTPAEWLFAGQPSHASLLKGNSQARLLFVCLFVHATSAWAQITPKISRVQFFIF